MNRVTFKDEEHELVMQCNAVVGTITSSTNHMLTLHMYTFKSTLHVHILVLQTFFEECYCQV